MDDPGEYCRQIEAYLCARNEGHLVRIVGPAFEQVCGWAAQGVPLTIAFRGIDRYCERYYAKGPRRRPVRIEFCEADVLELFDDWRRAVGVTAARSAEEAAPRKAPLAAHLERVVARLTALRGGAGRSEAFHAAVASAIRELDGLAADAKQARGEARARIIARLEELDAALAGAARAELAERTASELRREAEAELAPFGMRMDPAARARAVELAFERLVRQAAGLPVVSYQ